MKRIALITLLCLAGCSGPVEDAQKELAMLQDAKASPGDICKAQQKIATAMLEAHDQERFTLQKQIADQVCSNAEMEGTL